MKRNYYPLLLFFIIPFFTQAQSMERMLIATTGASFSNSAFSADYSVGEAIINTYSSAAVTLTQGFHQPPFPDVFIVELDHTAEPILYPNPGAGQYYLGLGQIQNDELQIYVIDNLGRQVYKHVYQTAMIQGRIYLNLSHFATGEYHLCLMDGEIVHAITFINVTN